MAADSTAIVWFRRDLRVHDHPALTRALKDFDRVVPLFVLDDGLLRGRFQSPSRTAFMLGCLKELDAALRERGSGLVIREGAPRKEVPKLAADVDAQAVLWTSEPGPYAMDRDQAIREALQQDGREGIFNPGSYVADFSKPRTGAGKPYTVFSPFGRAYAKVERRTVHRAPGKMPALPSSLAKGRLPAPEKLRLGENSVSDPIREAGEDAARKALQTWLDGPIDDYADKHDTLAGGTSVLSPYLRWGCLSAREIEERAGKKSGQGPEEFVRQIVWRDFYAHVLLHFPDNLHHAQHEKFDKLKWSRSQKNLEAWKTGTTGYPVVDAGMRQLSVTGWMHNRARLAVGSFLTKDLHIDWREGEAHFEALLLDGEPTQNNGNWQWIASVGVDPAPYFRRMFNPVTQQKKFDPDGEYVRRWVPELAEVPAEAIAEPWKLSKAERENYGAADYPEPIVDHKKEREEAMARYGAV